MSVFSIMNHEFTLIHALREDGTWLIWTPIRHRLRVVAFATNSHPLGTVHQRPDDTPLSAQMVGVGAAGT